MMQEVEVYINPEGFGDKYRQRIVPGDNTIRLPREFALKGGTLRFEVRGTRYGNWTVSYIPNQDNNVIIIDPEQLTNEPTLKLPRGRNTRHKPGPSKWVINTFWFSFLTVSSMDFLIVSTRGS